MFTEIKKINILDDRYIISLKIKFDGGKLKTINIKKIKRKLVEKIWEPRLIKKNYKVSGKYVETIRIIS